MRHAAVAALLGCLLARAATGATIDGQVTHPERPGLGGVTVRLLGLTRDGETLQRHSTTDNAGAFRFDDVISPGAYLVMAVYGGLSFPGGSAVFEEGDGDATRRVSFHVYDTTDDPSGIALTGLRWFVSREDAGVYRIDQVAEVRNPTTRVVLLDEAAPPILRIAVAPGAGPLRTATGHTPFGFELRDGVLELRGPVFPGPREVAFSYDVDAGGADLESEVYLPDGTPAFDLFVRDTGVAIEAGPLHPARATRDEEGTLYQRYVGFDLAADTRFPLVIRTLPVRSAGSPLASALLLALLGAGLVLFVGRPLTQRSPVADAVTDDPAEAEKQALYAALEDLEHDFETGKLTSADRDRLRDELRRDALRGLARVQGSEAAEPSPERACSCGHRPAAGDRFCASCGKPL